MLFASPLPVRFEMDIFVESDGVYVIVGVLLLACIEGIVDEKRCLFDGK